MAISVDKLEEVYENLLGIVKREIVEMVDKEKIDANDTRKLENYDKIIRASLAYYKGRVPDDGMSEMSDDDLESQLHES